MPPFMTSDLKAPVKSIILTAIKEGFKASLCFLPRGAGNKPDLHKSIITQASGGAVKKCYNDFFNMAYFLMQHVVSLYSFVQCK